MRILIKGAGDLASGIALRLFHCGYSILMTESPQPTTVRRSVAFSEAVYKGKTTVEDVTACLAEDLASAEKIISKGNIAVLADPDCSCRKEWQPDVLIDAIIAKHNTGTSKEDAPVVIGVGPGFTAGVDCGAVIETKRGHTLGRVILQGSAIENTGIPGNVGGYTKERLIQAPCEGIFKPHAAIGDRVEAGQIVASVGTQKVTAQLSGVVRGMLKEGLPVFPGMKCGDIDPRDCTENCFTVSDKALAIGGGVLEAILLLLRQKQTSETADHYVQSRPDNTNNTTGKSSSLQGLEPRVAIRFFNDKKCFGPGVADLLEGIEQAGSLRAASYRMNMSYSKAWSILRECENNIGYELVTREVGGARGGGAKLTEDGECLLLQYRSYCRDLNIYARELKKKY